MLSVVNCFQKMLKTSVSARRSLRKDARSVSIVDILETRILLSSISVVSGHADVTVGEGETVATFGDYSSTGATAVSVDASVGTAFLHGDGVNGFWSWTFDTTDGPVESTVVTVTITDADSLTASTTFNLNVNNVDPGLIVDSPDSSVYQGISFSTGDVAFADAVVDFEPGPGTAYTDTPQILGAPQGGANDNGLTLGNGGSVTVQFSDNVLTDQNSVEGGADLVLFDLGVDGEEVTIEISADGGLWINIGTHELLAGGPTAIDIGPFVNAGDEFQFVRVTDVPLSFTASNEFEGPDLDGIGVISALAPIVVDAGDMATLSGDFSDPGDDIVTVNSSIGTVSQDSGAAGGWNLAIDTSTLVPGSYTVVVTADDADGGTATASIELVVRPVDVSVGINIVQDRINLNSVAGSKSRGSNATLTVVVETTGTFDASDIDTSTILFAGASVDRSQLKDVDNDGDLDLVLKFRLRDTNLVDVYAQSLSENGSQPHKRNNRAKVELELTGQTNDGMEIRGSDTASVFMSGKALRKLFESIG
jgi:hypothetical protein